MTKTSQSGSDLFDTKKLAYTCHRELDIFFQNIYSHKYLCDEMDFAWSVPLWSLKIFDELSRFHQLTCTGDIVTKKASYCCN